MTLLKEWGAKDARPFVFNRHPNNNMVAHDTCAMARGISNCGVVLIDHRDHNIVPSAASTANLMND